MKPSGRPVAALAPAQLEALDRDGYLLLADALDADALARLRRAFVDAPVQEGGTQHVTIDETTPAHDAWRALEAHPALRAAAAHVLAGDVRLQTLHGRNPLPGFGQQGLHADWHPRQPNEPYAVLTALFLLDDFSAANGATRVVPGSHRLLRPIPKSLAQPLAHHPEERVIEGRAGSLLVFNGHLWHSGRRNTSDGPRRVVQLTLAAG